LRADRFLEVTDCRNLLRATQGILHDVQELQSGRGGPLRQANHAGEREKSDVTTDSQHHIQAA
jgi:hypothetical protein